MVIFVDGFQNTGKTTLVENSSFPHDSFPFTENIQALGLDTKHIPGYQLGKDLGMLFAFSKMDKNLLIDRGPLSSILYSLKEMRFEEETFSVLRSFADILAKEKNAKFIFVTKSGMAPTKREHHDGFDYLDDDNDPNMRKYLSQLQEILDEAGVRVTFFTNDFSKSEKENSIRFDSIVRKIFYEHD